MPNNFAFAIMHRISQLIGDAGKARADAYPTARYISNYAAWKTSI